jgi:hypothetical protein
MAYKTKRPKKRIRVTYKNNGKNTFIKPKARLYYTPAGLENLYIIRALLIIGIIGVGFWIAFLFVRGGLANSTCYDRCDYGGCMDYLYPYPFWLMPLFLIIEAILIYSLMICKQAIWGWIWNE